MIDSASKNTNKKFKEKKMKQKKFNKKLVVNKVTVSNLSSVEQSVIRGGGTYVGRTCEVELVLGTVWGRTCEAPTQ